MAGNEGLSKQNNFLAMDAEAHKGAVKFHATKTIWCYTLFNTIRENKDHIDFQPHQWSVDRTERQSDTE